MEKVFLDYVAKFDTNDDQIQLKIWHTLRTAKVSTQIAKDLGLDDENVNLAYMIAMLHDFARFEQWTQFKTFHDIKSIDHGDYAVELLFAKNLIAAFKIDPKYYPVIKYAVKFHNKFAIDKTQCPKTEFDANLHAEIVKDADKCDIAWIVKHSPLKMFKLTGNDAGTGVTPEVLLAIKNHGLVGHALIRTRTDSILSLLSHAYDLFTKPGMRIFVKEKYPIAIYKKYKPTLPPEDAEIVHAAAVEIMEQLSHKIK
jgi:hypothetical protein